MKISDFILRGLGSSRLPLVTSAAASEAPASLLEESLVVDLGYARYRGVLDSTTHIRHWRGIRYAAPPINELRYQAPQPPGHVSEGILNATDFSTFAQCPQTGTVPVGSNTAGVDLGSEDCLFVTVSSPAAAVDLPVFVWIHGGGFQNGNGKLDFSDMMQQSNNSFVVVTIQYRLNSFGFLSSTEVKQRGQLNAGLLDQLQALQWVQNHISLFGGNKSHVTLGGESAGAASIYYHVRAQLQFYVKLLIPQHADYWPVPHFQRESVDWIYPIIDRSSQTIQIRCCSSQQAVLSFGGSSGMYIESDYVRVSCRCTI